MGDYWSYIFYSAAHSVLLRLRDEYQKMRDFKHLAYGFFLAVGIVVPWYFAGLKGLLPTPHVLMTFFIICIPTYIMTIVSWFSK